MGQLNNLYVSSSYQGLLKMTDSTNGLTNTLQTVQTGDGDNSPLQMSLTQVNISGSFTVNGNTISGSTSGSSGTSGTSGSNGSSGTSGSSGSSGNGFVYRNEWTGTTAYNQNDVVTYNGQSYVALSANTDKQPSIFPSIWAVFSAAGTSGTSGTSGSNGSSGSSGTSGSNGSSGTSGSNGSSGTSGSSGSNGSSGTSGSNGSSGTSGSSGSNGSDGSSGTSGSNGSSGTSGSNGSSGTSGSSGSNGSDGSSGTSGSNGSSGTSGTSGTSGDSLFALTGSVWNTTNNVGITGSLNVTGSFVNNGLTYPLADNGDKSFIQTDGAGNLSLEYVDSMYETVRNMEATTLPIGTPLFVSGQTGDNANVYIADANDPARRPATLVAGESIAASATGKGLLFGLITNVDTNAYTAGQEVYLASGGGFTGTRPTGSAVVQLLGIITRVGNNGQGYFLNPGPYNLPNLTTGKIWMGDSNSYPSEKTPLQAGLVTTGSIGGSQSITGSLILGNTTISGSLIGNDTNNGLVKISSEAGLLNLDLSITSSNPVSQSNVVFRPSNPFSTQISTGSIILSGSNNILFTSTRPNTITGGTTDTYGYVNGTNNIFLNAVPTLNVSSSLRPLLTGNISLNQSNTFTFLTSSIGFATPAITSNIGMGAMNIVHPSGSISIGSNLLNLSLNSTANVTDLRQIPQVNNNAVFGNSISLFHNSGSINYSQNIGGTTVVNNMSGSIMTVSQNLWNGSTNQIISSGYNTAGSRTFNSNFLTGRLNQVLSNYVSGSLNTGLLFSTSLLGQSLIVSASNITNTDGGTVIVGRYNATGSLQESSKENIFVVGSGTSDGARRNALRIDSNGNTEITGSVNISGSLFVNGLSFSSGTSGTSGISGSSGTSGDSGSSGTSGSNGSSGTSGLIQTNYSGSLTITGSINGNVNALSIASQTASLNLDDGNFFTLQLVSGSNTRIEPSNIKPGQTINVLLNTTGSATVSFPTSVKQVSGSAYVPSTGTTTDIITLISFDNSSLYLANVKNLI